MGLKKAYLDYIQECAKDTAIDFNGKHMLELGNQECSDNAVPERTGKEYYTNRGVKHVSVDLNGEDGALKVDLSKPISFPEWRGRFDIITNAGTSEHVEPIEGQYVCFMNIHDCLKVGGIQVHLLPDINELNNNGRWKGHCNNYYSFDFFKMLQIKNDYKLVSLKIINGMVSACLQKQHDKPFMDDRQEFLRHITRKQGGIVYRGANDVVLRSRIRGLAQLLSAKIRSLTFKRTKKGG